MRTSAALLFVVHFSALNYSCWKGIGPQRRQAKQKKTKLVWWIFAGLANFLRK